MKKLLLLLTITIIFTGCASYKPRLVEDKFYKSNSYFTTLNSLYNYVIYNNGISNLVSVYFQSEHGKKGIKIFVYLNGNRFFIANNDRVVIKHKDGTEISLKYTSVVPTYSSFNNRYYISAVSKVISNYKDIDMIRIEFDGKYQNITISDKQNKDLRKIFDNIQKAANDYYK